MLSMRSPQEWEEEQQQKFEKVYVLDFWNGNAQRKVFILSNIIWVILLTRESLCGWTSCLFVKGRQKYTPINKLNKLSKKNFKNEEEKSKIRCGKWTNQYKNMILIDDALIVSRNVRPEGGRSRLILILQQVKLWKERAWSLVWRLPQSLRCQS